MTREMKNSGIEWIGEIPADWEIHRLKTCFTEHTGGAWGEEPQGNENDLICIRVADFDYDRMTVKKSDNYEYTKRNYTNDTIAKLKLKKNDILIEKSGGGEKTPVGRTIIFKEDFEALNANFIEKLSVSEYALPEFMQYLLVAFYKNKYTTKYIKQTTGIQNLDITSMLSGEKIVLPPLTEQKKITDFLDSKVSEIDKMIAETKSSIENYKEYKQSVITEAVTKGLNKDVQMKDSGIEWIGQIPAHWNVNAIKSVATTCSGGTPNSSDASLYDGDINWVCSYDLKEKPIFASGRKITQAGADTIAGYLQNIGSVLVAMYGGSSTIGNSGILECEARTNQAICSIKFNNQYIMDYYGFYYILAIRKYWMIYAVGTRKDPNISQDTVRKMPCVIPPLTEQELIIKHLDSKCIEIDKLISEKEALVVNLEEYKKSLIYEYVTGKKEVAVAKNEETVIAVAPIYPAVYNTKKARFAQAVLMSKILATSNNNKGRVKLEKTLYTIEHHIGFDFETEYTRDAAGPLDNSLYKCETIISRNNKWFNINSRNYRVSYKPTKNVDKYKYYYNNYFADYDTEIERIISIFDGFNTDQAEIIATLYGAWNDFIIDNKPFTADDVVNEVLNNWHDSKKRFSKDIWLRAMKKMRTLDLVPKGYGKKTICKEV